MSDRYFGLIPAGGTGNRFGAGLPKQYTPIHGRTMLEHTLRAMLAAPELETVFVVLATGDAEFRSHDWSAYGDRVTPVWCGGATRRDSVLNGLVAAANMVEPDDWILVHDAARPCLAAEDLRRLIVQVSAQAASTDAVGGILAVPVADTLKRADTDSRIAATQPRDGLWQAQTPQMFRYAVLLEAVHRAAQVTDEASAIEATGAKPLLVEGSAMNFKVTYPADLELAALILGSSGAESA